MIEFTKNLKFENYIYDNADDSELSIKTSTYNSKYLKKSEDNKNLLDVSHKIINDKKIKIIFDDGFYMPVYNYEYKKFFINECISENDFISLHKRIVNRAKKRVFYLLDTREYTRYEIESKLTSSMYHKDDISVVISYFLELGYLNDFEFASKYIDYYKDKKSIMQISTKLKRKGIDYSIINDIINSDTSIEKEQYDLARNIALKKYNSLKPENRRDKLYRYMLSKGYKHNLVFELISEFAF